MDPYFLFGSAANELLAALALGCAAVFTGLAFGSVYIYRFFRTKNRRQLYLGLAMLALVPLLACLVLCLDAWLIEKRVGPELVAPVLSQSDAKN